MPAGREDRPLPVEPRGGAGEAASAAAASLAAARSALDHDPHEALRAVDEAFKARPTFEEWYAAYRIRLEALIRLGEKTEALRTYERFRAKLRERTRPERLEELLLDASGPMPEVLDAAGLRAELVDLYAAMAGRERPFVEACVALAREHAAAGTPLGLRKAVSLLREAVAKGGDEATALWPEVAAKAREAGLSIEGPSPEDVRARVGDRPPPRILVVGGDEGDRAHAAPIEDVARRAGFAAHLVLGGARPPQRTLEEVEAAARGATALVLLHGTTPDVREGVRRLAQALHVPVREIPYAGAASLEPELLTEVAEVL